VHKNKSIIILLIFVIFIISNPPAFSQTYYILKDYYNILNIGYNPLNVQIPYHNLLLNEQHGYDFECFPNFLNRFQLLHDNYKGEMNINLEGEIELNISYGGDFPLKRDIVVGAGSEGINNGLRYDLIEKIILEGNIGERLFVEFDYDSKRSEEGIGEEKNIYSIMYKGKEDEFLKEVTVGNKFLSISDSPYIPIDEGNEDSFALTGRAKWRDFTLEGLFRYDVALKGEKHFKGYKRNVDINVSDIDYVKADFFLIPDLAIAEDTLLLYKTAKAEYEITVDGKHFELLERGIDYDFDNTKGVIYLYDALEKEEELIVYYKKNSVPVGDGSLGINAIINDTGNRVNFNISDFPGYFGADGIVNYLYLKKIAFNSYWEMKNVYYLGEIEGNNIYNIDVELLYTANGGRNDNYEDLMKQR